MKGSKNNQLNFTTFDFYCAKFIIVSSISKELLQKHWGFQAFRPLQEDIVDAVIYGNDVLTLLPTGGGKSLCFQLPGIAREGLTLVVSPLIALMDDQVINLQKRGFRAKAISSSMSFREIDMVLDNARFGGLDFLYISPERIQTHLFIERLKLMNLGLIVVDEAHCISEWGHDFRPAYLSIANIREYHPKVPIIALTATATEKVKADIQQYLEMRDTRVFEASFQRNNLAYEVYRVGNKLETCVAWINRHPSDVGIIYCQTRQHVKQVYTYLHSKKIPSTIYHGGMNSFDRQNALKSWLSESKPIMVATNAFGMGIDKPNVRFVIHYELPTNPEAYFQEAGRAGRDGKEAKAMAFVEPTDLQDLEKKVYNAFPEKEKVSLIYRAICNYLKVAIGSGAFENYSIDFADFTKKFKLNVSETFAAIKLLEMNGNILFSEHGLLGSRIKIIVDAAALYGFQLKNPDVDRLIVWLSRNYNRFFDEFCEIDEQETCKKLGISSSELIKQLKKMESSGIADINWRTEQPQITFLHERLPNDNIELKPEIYHFRKKLAIERLNTMKAYVDGKHCRPQFIIQYFGQESEPCGKCDYCRKVEFSMQYPNIELDILSAINGNPLSIGQLITSIDTSFGPQIKQTVMELIQQERLVFKNRLLQLPD